ncbi:CNP1-like family protein [Thiohalobacter sp. IOR34]|uniref:CNP1-like family protein n=1 Tax=Thiohalobacter sp. IOR34 TaxID=3057176 RepID=UPI0025B02EFE|nr:CNP1-like family protein [Thiohalobacter sp. IOR34]WJW76235.1 CNP1-like family protein [Thiohalobacter sp. IOR34]
MRNAAIPPSVIIHRAALLCTLLLAWQGPLVAGEDGPEWGSPEPLPAWQEQAHSLPPYPDADRLLRLKSQLPGAALEMLVDPASIEPGKDGVVRYTLVLRSPSGASNVFYEGIRCDGRQLKTYAYGSSGSWHPLSDPQWQALGGNGSMRYRRLLFSHLCNIDGSLPQRREILRRLRYGEAELLL